MKLILGGARSGKSSQAKKIADKFNKVIFVATGLPTDEEMKKRIKRHKEERPSHWTTIEKPVEVSVCLERLRANSFSGAVILDCLGFWVSNLMEEFKGREDEEAAKEILSSAENIMNVGTSSSFEFIVVSNMVGMGLIPTAKSGRIFRDILGQVNQIAADTADNVILMVAGIKQKIK